jgi:hypothetical protein
MARQEVYRETEETWRWMVRKADTQEVNADNSPMSVLACMYQQIGTSARQAVNRGQTIRLFTAGVMSNGNVESRVNCLDTWGRNHD